MKFFLICISLFFLTFIATGCTTSARFNRGGRSYEAVSETKELVGSEKRIIKQVNKYLGVPYKWGGASRSGMDCSGFVKKVFEKAEGVSLPHNTKKQAEYGKYIEKGNLEFGDIVFFKIKKHPVDHVGIFLGEKKIAHASTSNGVIIDDFSKDYYQEKFIFAKRLFIK